MSKGTSKQKKDDKSAPQKTLKEKRAAKRDKKHKRDEAATRLLS